MKTKILSISLIVIFSLINQSCKKPIYGCTDASALNFNAAANTNNGSCIAKVYGCTDATASNYNSYANVNNGTCTYTGQAMFWYNTSGTNATVTIGGYVSYITMYYPSYDPTCGDAGCASFNLPIGTYSYHAESTFYIWDGYVTITKNGCSKILLY